MPAFACLGDSITYGEGDTLGLGWVGRLNRFLQDQKPHIYGVYNLGICGDTVAGAYHRYHSEVLLREPDTVLIAIGTNDCQRAGTDQPVELRTGPTRLFRQWEKWVDALSVARHRTMILGVLPSDDTRMPYIRPGKPNNWVPSHDLKNYNDRLMALCTAQNLPFINFWDTVPSDFAQSYTVDGVHPNDAGYDVMFAIIRDALMAQKMI